MRSLSENGISPEVSARLLRDVESDSINKYNACWEKFASWCHGRKINSGNLSVNDFCTYLISVFDNGLSASTLRFVKSAISFFL